MFSNEKPKEKRKSTRILGGLSVGLIAMLSIALIVAITYNPVRSAFKAIGQGYYSEASDIFVKSIGGKSKREAEFGEELVLELGRTFNDYESGDVTYDETAWKLDQLSKFTIEEKAIESIKMRVDKINNSRVAFKRGNDFTRNKSYIEAMNNYNKVIEEDGDNYESAQKKSKEILENYKEEVLAKIDAYGQDQDYTGILSLINEAKKMLVQDPDINQQEILYTSLLKEWEEQEPVTLKTVSQFGGYDPSADVYDHILSEFRAENPLITIEDESDIVDEAWKAQVAADFESDHEPDVIFTFTGVDAQVMIDQRKVVPIHEIRAKFPHYASHISPTAMKSVQEMDGNSYAVPVRGFYEGLFINEEIFRDHNLELPTDWAKMETAIQELKEKGIVPIAAALGDQPHYWIEHLILSQGGPEAHGNRDLTAVRDEWIAGLGHFKSLYDMGAFPKDTNTMSNDIVVQMFSKGQAAMMLEGNWAIGGFYNPEDITVIPFPVVPGGQAGSSDMIGGFSSGWYITRQAWEDPAKRIAAVKFITKMTSTEAIGEFVALGGTPAADIGWVDGLPQAAIDGFAIQAAAENVEMPIDAWLAKPAWDKLLGLIPGLATGQEDVAIVVNEVIRLNK